jgi:hypothetical protein
MGGVGVVVPWHVASLTARDAIHAVKTAKAAVMKKSRSMSCSSVITPGSKAAVMRAMMGRDAR